MFADVFASKLIGHPLSRREKAYLTAFELVSTALIVGGAVSVVYANVPAETIFGSSKPDSPITHFDPTATTESTLPPTLTPTSTLEPTAIRIATATPIPTETQQQAWLKNYELLKTDTLTLEGNTTSNRITAKDIQILKKDQKIYAYTPAKPLNGFEFKGEIAGVASYQKIGTTDLYALRTIIPMDSDGNLSFQFLDKDNNLSGLMKYKYNSNSTNPLGVLVTNKLIPLGQEWKALPAGVTAKLDAQGLMQLYNPDDTLYVAPTSTPRPTFVAPPKVESTPAPQFETSFGGNTAMQNFAKAHGIECPVGTTVLDMGDQWWFYGYGSECKFGNVPITINLAGVDAKIPSGNGWSPLIINNGTVTGWGSVDTAAKAKVEGYGVVIGYQYSLAKDGSRVFLSGVLVNK